MSRSNPGKNIESQMQRMASELIGRSVPPLPLHPGTRTPTVGTDLIQVARVERAIVRWGNNFLDHCFTDREIDYCKSKRRPDVHFAGRLAAKEAVYKALRPAPPQPFYWPFLEILRGRDGEPEVSLNVKLAEAYVGTRPEIRVSIAHVNEFAIAVAIARQ